MNKFCLIGNETDTSTLIDENENSNTIKDDETNDDVISFTSSQSVTPTLENFNLISEFNKKSFKVCFTVFFSIKNILYVYTVALKKKC